MGRETGVRQNFLSRFSLNFLRTVDDAMFMIFLCTMYYPGSILPQFSESSTSRDLPEKVRSFIHDLRLQTEAGQSARSRLASGFPRTPLSDFFQGVLVSQDDLWYRNRRTVLTEIVKCLNLSYVNLKGFQINSSRTDEVQIICDGLAKFPSLHELTVSENSGFGTLPGCRWVTELVKCSRTLKVLKMSDVEMDDIGLEYIVKAACSYGALEELDVSLNHRLGNNGAKLLTKLLEFSTSLRVLDMAAISMGVDGASHFAAALASNCCIKELKVSSDGSLMPLKEIVAACVPQASRRSWSLSAPERATSDYNRNLLTLDMDILYAPEDYDFAELVANMLQVQDTCLTKLGLRHAQFGSYVWTRIFQSLHRNKTLEILDLRGCKGLRLVFENLMELLKWNDTIHTIETMDSDLLKSMKTAIWEKLESNKGEVANLAVLERIQPKTVRPKHARLFLFGPARGGKTTLGRTMTQRAQDRPKMVQLVSKMEHFLHMEHSKTIEVLQTYDMKISIWDLGGQNEFFVLHECLFTRLHQVCVFFFVFNLQDYEVREDRLERELLFLLRFIISNSRSCNSREETLPRVTVVFTHRDKVKTGVLDSRAKNVVSSLRERFMDHLHLSEKVYAVDARNPADVDGVLQETTAFLSETLRRLPPVPRACVEMAEVLADWNHANHGSKPAISISDFEKLCSDKCPELKFQEEEDSLESEPSTGPFISRHADSVGRLLSKNRRLLVLQYLHDVGSVIYFKSLNFVVVDLNWLVQVFLGSLFTNSGNNAPPSNLHMTSSSQGFVPKQNLIEILNQFIHNGKSPGFHINIHNFKKIQVHRRYEIAVDNLLQLMIKLELCYEDESPQAGEGHGYFVPTWLGYREQNALRGLRKLKWSATRQPDEQCTYVGRRLVCSYKDRTFLTPGFFPRFQVSLRKKLKRALNQTQLQYTNECNLIKLHVDGYEILVESSGDNGEYVDVLVRSSSNLSDTIKYVQDHVIKNLKEFCSSSRGCPGVDLVEAIIRPQCVEFLTLCEKREKQAVPVEALKKHILKSKTLLSVMNYPHHDTSQVARRTVEDSVNYQHTWPTPSDSNLRVFDKAGDLLGLEELEETILQAIEIQKRSLREQRSRTDLAYKEVMDLSGLRASSSGIGSAAENVDDPYKRTRNQPPLNSVMSDREYRYHQHLFNVHQDLAERIERVHSVLLSVTNPLIVELRNIQQNAQRVLMSKLYEIMGIAQEIRQQGKLPSLPYLSDNTRVQKKIVAAVRIGQAFRLHLMCENLNGPHIVQSQKGLDITVQDPKWDLVRHVVLGSCKVFYFLLKAGLHVAAGIGQALPNYTNMDEAIPLTVVSLTLEGLMPEDINLTTLSQNIPLDKNSDGWNCVQDLLASMTIQINDVFELSKVKYTLGSSIHIAWVCSACRKDGLKKGILEIFPH